MPVLSSAYTMVQLLIGKSLRMKLLSKKNRHYLKQLTKKAVKFFSCTKNHTLSPCNSVVVLPTHRTEKQESIIHKEMHVVETTPVGEVCVEKALSPLKGNFVVTTLQGRCIERTLAKDPTPLLFHSIEQQHRDQILLREICVEQWIQPTIVNGQCVEGTGNEVYHFQANVCDYGQVLVQRITVERLRPITMLLADGYLSKFILQECWFLEKVTTASFHGTPTEPLAIKSSTSPVDTESQQRFSIFSTGSTVSSSVSPKEEPQEHDNSNTDTPTLPGAASSQGRSRILSIDTANQKKNIGINHFNRKPIDGIQYLVKSQILENSPWCVAEFLVHASGLSREKVGEFLGEINSTFNMKVLNFCSGCLLKFEFEQNIPKMWCLVELMDMSSKPIDEALRLFQKIFRMPGEAQKIDKVIEVFAVEYFKSNRGVGSIRSEDAAYILSFAIMMLHTSLHNPSVKLRITRKQWVTMNRGCNEGENFEENLLLDIYNRLQLNQFTTGKDHTDEVLNIEKQIIGRVAKLANPQRRFLQKLSISEVMDLNSRPSFWRNKHKRVLFLFNDIMIVCKDSHMKYKFKDSISLLNLTAVQFESHYYKHGLQFHSSLENRVVLQCNCDSSQDRNEFLVTLEIATAELTIMETDVRGFS